MRKDNIEILNETLHILEQGTYSANGKHIDLKLTRQQMQQCHVLLPEDVERVCKTSFNQLDETVKCEYACVPMDSYAAAVQLEKERIQETGEAKPVLVLNFANPVNIGGGVYHGAKAQEEGLCRRSSLLVSLESEHALRYYQYNRNLKTYMGSDAMIFSPQTEVFRDEHGELMDETTVVAVLTCAAPMITYGLEGMSEEDYQSMFYNRILGVLKCAAYFGYDHLVLGAWGCGAFGNDASIVSDLFYKALNNPGDNENRECSLFKQVVFAIRSHNTPSYNFQEFYRNFGEKHF